MASPCPTCQQPVPSTSTSRPFCSERCRMVDLGRWLGDEYRIAAEPADPELLPNAPAADDEN